MDPQRHTRVRCHFENPGAPWFGQRKDRSRDPSGRCTVQESIWPFLPKSTVFELFQELPGIVCIAETSADERAIKQTTKQADKQKLNFFASAPCASSKLDPSAKSRPLYGGVGILTHRASRVPECQRSLDEWQSTRYLETIVKIGVSQVLVLTLYLHARDENFFLYKKDASDALLQRAIARISEWGGPAIIAGDFNQPPAGQGLDGGTPRAQEPSRPTKRKLETILSWFPPSLAVPLSKSRCVRDSIFPNTNRSR